MLPLAQIFLKLIGEDYKTNFLNLHTLSNKFNRRKFYWSNVKIKCKINANKTTSKNGISIKHRFLNKVYREVNV